METVRDLSFDYAERVKGETLNELEYSRIPVPNGQHFHFWVPSGMTIPAEYRSKIKGAYGEARAKFAMASASWDFIPMTAERSPSQKHIQHKELFLIDWRIYKNITPGTTFRAFCVLPNAKVDPAEKPPDFEIVEMINTTEWTCGARLTFDEVNSILKRGDVTIRIQLPQTYKQEAK